ncbi:MAG: hemolysin III family protein [Gammaproteobacteria bacterium]|nr:hemolysin III family protein [Gammaproteobacteria bacterium]MDH5778675.1 hemolysin III family protein [Gammaproteobacteria bacterium]
MDLSPIIAIPGFSEPFSSLLHLLAAAVFLVLGVALVSYGRGHPGRVASLIIFIFSVVFLLSMSGVFHLLEPGSTGRMVLQRLDHAGIFLLIAGTFTPIHSILFKGVHRWGVLGLVWGIALSSIVLKTIFFNDMAEWLSLSLYLGLGWFGAVTGILLYQRHGYKYIKTLIYGAVAYTAGAVLEFMRFPELIPGIIGPHELFHIAVLFGIGYHFAFVYRCTRTAVLPTRLKTA